VGSAELFESKSEVINRVAWTFVRRTRVFMDIDDARQVAALAAWRILEKHGDVGDGLLAIAGYRALSDEMRSGRVTGIARSGHARGDLRALSLNSQIPTTGQSIDGAPLYYIDVLDDREDSAYEAVDEAIDAERRVAHALTKIPARHRFVVYLYFFEGLTQAQIGEMLDVTESRICQLLASAKSKLRPLLAAA
jgi:RNA polymerase sigma factor (sigma-70 family)